MYIFDFLYVYVLWSEPQPGGSQCPLPDVPALPRVSDLYIYARRMGQPTQRAANYIARSNIDPAQIFFYANGQSTPQPSGDRHGG